MKFRPWGIFTKNNVPYYDDNHQYFIFTTRQKARQYVGEHFLRRSEDGAVVKKIKVKA